MFGRADEYFPEQTDHLYVILQQRKLNSHFSPPHPQSLLLFQIVRELAMTVFKCYCQIHLLRREREGKYSEIIGEKHASRKWAAAERRLTWQKSLAHACHRKAWSGGGEEMGFFRLGDE
jgi:hypothetical protein